MIAVLVGSFTFARAAGAATYATTCPDPSAPSIAADVGAYATAQACIAETERLELIESDLAASSSSSGTTSSVELAGSSQVALEDVRRLEAYTLGFLVALLFAFTFWRTFGSVGRV